MTPVIFVASRPFYLTGNNPQKEEVISTLLLLKDRLKGMKESYDPMMQYLIDALGDIAQGKDANKAFKLSVENRGKQNKGSNTKEIELALKVAELRASGKTVEEAIEIVSSDKTKYPGASFSSTRAAYYKWKKAIQSF